MSNEFRAGAKVILYTANTALIRCTTVTAFTIISVFDSHDFTPIYGPLAILVLCFTAAIKSLL